MSAPGDRRPRKRGQLGALRHTFLARLFDNEITGGSDDLKASYFWLIGFLAGPSFLLGVSLMMRMEQVARLSGAAGVRAEAPSTVVLYLSWGMVASGVLAAVTWSSLLLDRRDALILGSLPVTPRRVVVAKLTALMVYLGMLGLAMNGPGALSVGFALAAGSDLTFVLRGIATHLVVGTLSFSFLFLVVTSLQGLALTFSGPRLFMRISAALQVILIACVLVGFVFQPFFSVATHDTLRGYGALYRPWLLGLPPFWFLGTYEWLLGTTSPIVTMLNRRALGGIGAAALVTVATYLSSYSRLSRAAVEGRDGLAPRPRTAAIVERLVRMLSGHPVTRAAAQFYATSLGRVERLRFIIAMAVGVVVGWSGPFIYIWMAANADRPDNDPDRLGPTMLLTLSFVALALLLTGLRIAAAIPSDLKASWIVPAIGSDGRRLRSGLWRMLYVFGVLPVTAMFAAVIGWFFGSSFAAGHAVILLTGGALCVELLLWDHEQMPHVSPWRPERLELGKRWPLYVFVVLFGSILLASVENLLLGRAVPMAAFAGLLIAAGVTIRIAHHRRLVIPRDDEIHEIVDAPAVLRIG